MRKSLPWLWGNSWGIKRLFTIWFVLFVGAILFAKMGWLDGDGIEREQFSREECRKRHMEPLYERNLDFTGPADLTEDQIYQISRACASEETQARYPNG
jgi:hypothetical protein